MTEWTPEDLEAQKRRNPDFAAMNPGLDNARKLILYEAEERSKRFTGIWDRGEKKPKRKQPEKELEQFVHDTAKACGLLYYHTYRSRFSEPGFPDCLIIGRYLLIAELKATGKFVTTAQWRWLKAFDFLGIKVRIWHPEDKDDIIKTLQDMRTSK